jgi:hypothetical protein
VEQPLQRMTPQGTAFGEPTRSYAAGVKMEAVKQPQRNHPKQPLQQQQPAGQGVHQPLQLQLAAQCSSNYNSADLVHVLG